MRASVVLSETGALVVAIDWEGTAKEINSVTAAILKRFLIVIFFSFKSYKGI
jgi:hypothetical protein